MEEVDVEGPNVPSSVVVAAERHDIYVDKNNVGMSVDVSYQMVVEARKCFLDERRSRNRSSCILRGPS